MIKTRIIPALLAAVVTVPGAAFAAGGGAHVEDVSFSYEGPFGTYDKHQLQRGFQIFHEVCASCHGLQYLSFRELGSEIGPAFPPEQVKAIAALYEVPDEEGEPGDTRPGKPFDHFPRNTGADAPDLSLMAKARAGFHGPYGLGLSQLFNGIGGAEYIYSLMAGYVDEPECAADAEMDGYYNEAFAVGGYPDSCKDEEGHHTVVGSWISMPPPLEEDLIEYQMHGGGDGHGDGDEGGAAAASDGGGYGGGGSQAPEATVEQMSEDVSAFLMWAAEPQMTDRKRAGFRNILILLTLTVLLYFTNKVLWAKVKRKE